MLIRTLETFPRLNEIASISSHLLPCAGEEGKSRNELKIIRENDQEHTDVGSRLRELDLELDRKLDLEPDGNLLLKYQGNVSVSRTIDSMSLRLLTSQRSPNLPE